MKPRQTVIELGGAIIDSATVIAEPIYFVMEDGVIRAYVRGRYQQQPGEEPVDLIRKTDKIAIPGLINTHGHAAMTLLRGAGDDMPLMNWLHERIFPLEEKLTEEATYWGTQLAAWEMLISGTTTYTDMYMMMENTARAVSESGMRGVLSVGVVGFDEDSRAKGLSRSRQFVADWQQKAQGRITVMLGPHAPYTCPPDFLTEIAELAAVLNVPIQIHLSETKTEVEDCLKQHGVTPIELAQKVGLFNLPLLAAHCVHVTDADLDIMATHGVRVAHNPQSNLKLGSGVAPLQKMLERNMVVGLGTDGAASNNNLDMFEEMRLAATLHKGVHQDAEMIPAATAFQMATELGAKACCLETGLGTLQPGSPCDMVLLDGSSPHLMPRHNLLSDVVYACGADDVRDVFIQGRQVVANGQPLTIDTERVKSEVARLKKIIH
ncbi:amidohydrolase [Alicyclobacillus fodiniaquatilis]|uniref:5-methylthioadenosine/S-adenosylhomocysteine deaminase n=1 Tax=Alicyclobacillus fodiniaquatilis TaxID=1661150 RepID=A0ABW4JFJ7_9BACL